MIVMDADPKKIYAPMSDNEVAETLKPKRPKFEVGNIIEIDGVPFRLRKITKKDIILRPIKKKKGETKNDRKPKAGDPGE